MSEKMVNLKCKIELIFACLHNDLLDSYFPLGW